MYISLTDKILTKENEMNEGMSTISEKGNTREVVELYPTGAKKKNGKPVMDSRTFHQTKVNGNWQATKKETGRGNPKKITGQGFPY